MDATKFSRRSSRDPAQRDMQHDFCEIRTTGRLVLRRYRREDTCSLTALLNSSRSELTREFVQMTAIQNPDDANAFITRKNEEWVAGSSRCYGIWLKNTGVQIGQIQLKQIDWEGRSAELSYFIGKPWQRCGYASEGIKSVVGEAFTDLHFQKMFVRILPVNCPSLELAKKLGFREERVHRQEFRCGFGELHDVHYLALTIDDYSGGSTLLEETARSRRFLTSSK